MIQFPFSAFGIFSALCVLGVFFHLLLCLLAYLRDRLWYKICRMKEENEEDNRLKIAKQQAEKNQTERPSMPIENKDTIGEEGRF